MSFKLLRMSYDDFSDVFLIVLSIFVLNGSGEVVNTLKENGNQFTWGNVTVKLAGAYGFCWGVERAVQIAYEARKQFPSETIWITNEIIHNPTVNKVLQQFNFSCLYSFISFSLALTNSLVLFVFFYTTLLTWLWNNDSFCSSIRNISVVKNFS